jgi:hypothetical protein
MNPDEQTEDCGAYQGANSEMRAVSAHMHPWQRHGSSTISPEHIAVLDRAGRIVSFNELTCRCAAAAASNLKVGSNYTDACGAAFRLSKEERSSVAVAVDAVLSGERRTCTVALPSGMLAEGQTLRLRFYRLDGADSSSSTATNVFVEATACPDEWESMTVPTGVGGLFGQATPEVLQNIRHELRTPLNAVIGFSDLLRNEPLEPAQQEKVGFVHQAANDLLELVNNIIDCSSPESEAMQLSSAPFNLRKLIERAVRRTQRQSPYNVLQFECEIDPRIPQLLSGDAGRLRHVLNALLSNAVKFTRQGEVCVRAAVQESSDAYVILRFDVCDTGIGIPTEDQERIFQPFVQGDSSTTRSFGGMGTGLTLCRRLVTAMKGRINLESEPGKGSTFSVTLPVSMAAATSRATKLEPPHVRSNARQMTDSASTASTGQPDDGGPMNHACTAQDAWQRMCEPLLHHLATHSWKESEAHAQQLHELAGVRGWKHEADQAFRLVLAIRRRSPSQAKAIIARLQESASRSLKTATEVALT